MEGTVNRQEKKKILVVNDDGIEAPGIKELLLHLINAKKYNIRVIAPSTEQSAKSHSISIHGCLEAEPYQYSSEPLSSLIAYRVFGTPVDCVKLALAKLLDGFKPDLVISGINKGNNAGLNTLSSGTVGAAVEARVKGLNAVAFSLDHPATYVSGTPHLQDNWNYPLAAKKGLSIIEDILHHNVFEGVLLNVNFPNVRTEEEIKGFKKTRQGWSGWTDVYMEGPKQGEKRSFVIKGLVNLKDESNEYDTFAMRNGWITVTPLGVHFDPYHLSDYVKCFTDLDSWSIFKNK